LKGDLNFWKGNNKTKISTMGVGIEAAGMPCFFCYSFEDAKKIINDTINDTLTSIKNNDN
jgi:hypothetical protein